MTRAQRKIKAAARAADLIASTDPHEQETGWHLARFLRRQDPADPGNVSAPVTQALPEVRPGVFANTTDPAFLAALE